MSKQQCEIQISNRSLFTNSLNMSVNTDGYVPDVRYSFECNATIDEWQFCSDRAYSKGAEWVLLKYGDKSEYTYCYVVAESFQSGTFVNEEPQGRLKITLRVKHREQRGPHAIRRDSRGRWASLHRPLQNKRLYRYDVCLYLSEAKWLHQDCCGSCHCEEGMHSMEDFEDEYPGRLYKYIQLGVCHPVHNYMRTKPLSRDQWAALIKLLRKEDRDVKKS